MTIINLVNWYLLVALVVYYAISWAREFDRPRMSMVLFDACVSLLWIVIVPLIVLATIIVAVWYGINYWSEKKTDE